MRCTVWGIALGLVLVSAQALASCPAAPTASQDDMVLRFPAQQGVWVGSASMMETNILNSATNVEGVVVYDATSKTLKLCDGTNWQALSGVTAVTVAAGTKGDIQFNNGHNELAADSALFWDDTDKRLGLGTKSPVARLSVIGDVNIEGQARIHLPNATESSFPTASTVGHRLLHLIGHNQGIEFGTSRVFNDRKSWILARHTGTDGFGEIYSTLHIQPRIDIDSNYRGVAIGRAASEHTPVGRSLWVTGAAQFNAATDDSVALSITPDGQIGIGTATPQSRLHVAGGVKIGDDTGACPGVGNAKLGTMRFSAGSYGICLSSGWGTLSTTSQLGIAALTGDVTASGTGSVVATIANNAVVTAKIANSAVTNAKLANMPAATVKGNSGTGAAVPADLTMAVLRGMIGSGTANNATFLRGDGTWAAPVGDGQGITALTGDVTASGAGSVAATIANNAVTSAKILDGTIVAADLADSAVATAKIANSAVTLAKMQNLTAGRLLGRTGASAGAPQEITLGAGLTMPAAALTFDATWGDGRYLRLSGGTLTGNLFFTGATRYIGTSDNNTFVLRTNNTNRLTITGAGAATFSGNLTAPAFLYSSDIRLKGGVEPVSYSAKDLAGVSTYRYYYKADKEKSRHVGVMAQEVQAVVPEAVRQDEGGMLAVDYPVLVPVLLSAIQQMSQDIEALRDEVQTLREMVQP